MLRTLTSLAAQTLMLVAVLAAQQPSTTTGATVPVTGSGDSEARTASISQRASSAQSLPSLHEFASAVANEEGSRVVGVYVPEVLALRVLQQPGGNAGYVTSTTDAVSQFGMAASHGTIGLLAHNHLSGEQFFRLEARQTVVVVRADGTRERFRIDSVQRYQALSPSSAVSDFLELDHQGRRISARQLFNQMYARPDQLVFQTCIARDGNPYWGRLFVVATPLKLGPGTDQQTKFHRLLVAEAFAAF